MIESALDRTLWKNSFRKSLWTCRKADNTINPLNAKLNPICHLLALLEAHRILHVSRIRVNELMPLANNIPLGTPTICI